MREFDVVIVGAGLAGLTAALYAGRYGLRVGVVDQMGAGGQIVNVEKIENFPGFPEGVAGFDLGPMVQEQAEAAGAEFIMDTVEGLEIDGATRVVHCAEEDLHARAVIIAAGSSLRSLGIPGEERLLGKGVSHCASCDAPFFAGQDACVIGGGDSALDEAVVLAGQASRVLLIHRGADFEAQQSIVDRVAATPNIEPVFGTEVEEILGDDSVSALSLRDVDTGMVREEALSGVFIFVGLEPNTAFVRGILDLDEAGHIRTDILMRTSVEGVFAAGDIRQGSVAQLVSAAGDGATAAVAAFRYLNVRT
ncbi:MAG TPA: FAD-dependent oxidoreductase, partial [Dehalococcoidia bacterium]|nr:FAD-dependent oxidoreductase [Dehalococcoidia bacterium]